MGAGTLLAHDEFLFEHMPNRFARLTKELPPKSCQPPYSAEYQIQQKHLKYQHVALVLCSSDHLQARLLLGRATITTQNWSVKHLVPMWK
jgi:hypothetical protein